ncbi:amidohydrolase family protein [Nonomuraea sp. NPDC050536]|uniref:amidohydrolase family protein n=1 Tax=Nonomuraea sp. NPDC050536 TaxID=3364366 RepID=UPI0037C88F4C
MDKFLSTVGDSRAAWGGSGVAEAEVTAVVDEAHRLGYRVAAHAEGLPGWTPRLADLARRNLDEACRTLEAARTAGVPIALGHDWQPFSDAATEIVRMVRHGMSRAETLVAATATAARALGLDDRLGTVEPGKLADLVVVDGDPLADPGVLRDRARIWLVLQLGEPVSGQTMEANARTAAVSRSADQISALSNGGSPSQWATASSWPRRSRGSASLGNASYTTTSHPG